MKISLISDKKYAFMQFKARKRTRALRVLMPFLAQIALVKIFIKLKGTHNFLYPCRYCNDMKTGVQNSPVFHGDCTISLLLHME